MIYIIIAIIILIIVLKRRKKYAFPPLSTVTLVTGGVKSGKSTFAVWKAITEHRSRLIRTKIYNFFHKKNKKEIPLLYSNIPLKYKYYRVLTLESIMRKERFYYGSVVYVNEASLLADSMSYKDEEVNESLLLFNKLFGHETYGGFLIYDTQSLSDCHYAIKRCISEYVHLDGKKMGLFSVKLGYRRMKMLNASESIDVNVFDGKEEDRPQVKIPKRCWKMFDAFCFSSLTDDLPISDSKYKKKGLKTTDILTVSAKRFLYEKERLLSKEKSNDRSILDETKKILPL